MSAVEDLKVKLARIPVARHRRATKKGNIVKVRAHTRQIDTPMASLEGELGDIMRNAEVTMGAKEFKRFMSSISKRDRKDFMDSLKARQQASEALERLSPRQQGIVDRSYAGIQPLNKAQAERIRRQTGARVLAGVAGIAQAAVDEPDAGKQQAYWRMLKSRTTRAEKLIKTDPARALNELDQILREFESVGYPDWWSRVERGRNDALFARRDQDGRDWGAGIPMGAVDDDSGRGSQVLREAVNAGLLDKETVAELRRSVGRDGDVLGEAIRAGLLDKETVDELRRVGFPGVMDEAKRRDVMRGRDTEVRAGPVMPKGKGQRFYASGRNSRGMVESGGPFASEEAAKAWAKKQGLRDTHVEKPPRAGKAFGTTPTEAGIIRRGGDLQAERRKASELRRTPQASVETGGVDYPGRFGGMKTKSGHRPLSQIAAEIRSIWGAKTNFAAKPYLEAMLSLNDITDNYMADSGASVVSYLLGNMSAFRGEDAKRIKAELKAILKKA